MRPTPKQGIGLLATWRRSGDPRSFEDWLRAQQKRGRISKTTFDLATESIHRGEAITQTLATLEGFMAGFHIRAVNEREDVLFKQLTDMSHFWPFATTVQGSSVSRLRDYRCRAMDAAHRRTFDSFVAKKFTEVAGATISEIRDMQHLFRRLKEFAHDRCPAVK